MFLSPFPPYFLCAGKTTNRISYETTLHIQAVTYKLCKRGQEVRTYWKILTETESVPAEKFPVELPMI
jgi:hypothetical protein